MTRTDRKRVRLSERLAAVAGLVPECDCLVDIGTDHAFLPITLVEASRCRRALAADIRPGPLRAARRNILAAELADQIDAIQTDGLENIPIEADDVVVIAGLGGHEMIRILGGQPRRCKRIVLQPMKSIPELREWLTGSGYAIDEESLAVEQNRVYPILCCRYDGRDHALTALEKRIGPRLMACRPDGFDRYLKKLRIQLEKQTRGDPELAGVILQIDGMLKRHFEEIDPTTR